MNSKVIDSFERLYKDTKHLVPYLFFNPDFRNKDSISYKMVRYLSNDNETKTDAITEASYLLRDLSIQIHHRFNKQLLRQIKSG